MTYREFQALAGGELQTQIITLGSMRMRVAITTEGQVFSLTPSI